MCVALVSLGAGAQSAGSQAALPCAKPVIAGTFPYATATQLVPIEVTGVAPGTEYLLKVNNREVKEGIADSDKVSRKFRMPNLGDKRRDARMVMVLANEGCENSPWKLKREIGYRPPPVTAEPTPPVSQPAPTPTPTPTPTPAAPTVKTPAPKPVKPRLTTPAKPIVPQQPTTVTPLEPAPDAKAWVTPIDPYSRSAEKAPQPEISTNPSDRSTEQANSTAALVGLVGLFILLGGVVAVAWTRFRRYDDEQLATLLNPDGKLPAMLDDAAVDLGEFGMTGAQAKSQGMAGGTGVGGSRQVPVAAGAAVVAAGVDAPSDQEQQQSATPVAEPAPVAAAQTEINAPTIPPATIRAPIVPPVVAVPAPANGAPVPNGAQAPNGAEPPTPVAEPPAPVAVPPTPVVEPPAVEQPRIVEPPIVEPPIVEPSVTEPAPVAAHASNGADAPSPSYRGEVETELQRILRDAGLDSELESILTDARAEAQRQGVAMDSGIMLRALTDDTKGSAKLSDHTKGELEHRFQRIAAEERSQSGPTGEQ